ncbi:MULE transposase domain [Sesbania bispinosa]|nr:MULE transposase domain [Sesbania bispinosa]
MEDSMGDRSDLNDENNAPKGREGMSSSNGRNGNNVDGENGGVECEGEHMDEHSDAEDDGFAGRRWNVLKNKRGEVTQQEFVCYKEGFRDKKHLQRTGRKREPESNDKVWLSNYFLCATRSRKWSMEGESFNDVHSHELLAEEKRDMYNEIVRERRIQVSDARSALSYLSGLGQSNADLYWRHTADAEGRLQHLFWCDGRSQYDYRVFGVVAFDPTYRRNKYMCPFVVFAGVNNHNQTIVFGCGLVANETEETYVWLLTILGCHERTTSRCEGLNCNLADFESIVGHPVLLTPLQDIEHVAARQNMQSNVLKEVMVKTCREKCGQVNATQELVRKYLGTLKEDSDAKSAEDGNESDDELVNVRDPVRVRTKGCGLRQTASNRRGDRRRPNDGCIRIVMKWIYMNVDRYQCVRGRYDEVNSW